MAPKLKILHFFLHISPPHPLPFKNILYPCIELPQCYISCSVVKLYVVTGAHYVTQSKILLFT